MKRISSRLLERQGITDAVARLLDQARSRAGGALFVVAEPGLGKTAVLDYACRRARDEGFVVGGGCGHVMETWLPFGLLAQALTSLGGRHVTEDAVQVSASGDSRGARFYRVLRWLGTFDEAPVLLALDDLHWADPDSLSFVSFLCRRLAPTRVALIATLRPWPPEAHQNALRLSHDGTSAIERLAPLSEGGTQALLEGRLDQPLTDEALRQALRICAGNPLLLEHVALAVDQGQDVSSWAKAAVGGVSRDLLLERFGGLSTTELRCAQAAAVLGTGFFPEIAGEVAGLDGSQTDTALEALTRGGLIDQTSEGLLDFVHPLFCQALYEDLTAPTRSRLHARAYTAFARRGLDPDAAAHAVRANLVGNREAVAVLERVGRTARLTGALASAKEHLGAAVALAGHGAGPELLLAAGEACLAGGGAKEAVSILERTIAHPESAVACRRAALAILGRALALTGSHDRAGARFEEAIALSSDEDAGVAAQVLLQYATVSWLTVGPARALPLALRAREHAKFCDEKTKTSAECIWAFMALQSGDQSGVDAILDAARFDPETLGEEVAGSGGSWGYLVNSAMALTLIERFEEADVVLRALRDVADRVCAPQLIATLANAHGYTSFLRGQLREALDLNGLALSLVDLVPMIDAFAAAGHAGILLHMGRLDESQTWCERAEPIAMQRGEWNALLLLWDLLGHRHLREGRPEEACELYARIEATVERMGLREPCLPPWAQHGISAYLASGRFDDAARVVEWLEECAKGLPCRFPRIAAATGRAQLAESRGDQQAAHEAFRTAVALHDEVDRPLDKVETLICYGGFLRRAGLPVEARRVLAEALEVAEASSAEWLAELARGELRVAGGRRRRQKEPDGLTEQEQRVARIASTGATNVEIARQLHLSVSTIRTHLERIYAKLGIHSRRELIAMARTTEVGEVREATS